MAVLALILLFICAAAVIQPRSYAITQDVQDFQDNCIMPTMTVSADYFEPTRRVNFNYTFKITFPPLTPVKDNILSLDYQQGAHKVTEFIDQGPNQYISNYNDMQFQEVNHWANGTITYTPLDKNLMQGERDNGVRYEGWFPSPAQVCDYIGWINGWELNYIYAASHDYEAKSGNTIPDYIFEQTVPNCIVSHDYNASQMVITQQNPLLAKMLGPAPTVNVSQFPKEALYCNITPIAFQIANMSKAPVPPTWIPVVQSCFWLAIIIVVAIIIISVCNAWVQTDTTPYGLKDLGDAHKKGYNQAKNETYDDWATRLANLLRDGKISNETYWLLTGVNNKVYADVGAKYVNPYNIPSGGGANDWIHTIIDIITMVVIIALILVGAYCVFWVLRILGVFRSKKSGEGGTTNIFPSSRQATITLKQIYLQALSTGCMA